jgi:hypothetical protein
MQEAHEKEIFAQEIALSNQDIQTIITDFFNKAIDAYDIKWKIEIEGIKQILIVYRDNILSPENEVRNGYFEINPSSTLADKPVRLRVVSLREELDIWWLNLAQNIQSRAVAPNISPAVIAEISNELLKEIPIPGLQGPETQSGKPKKPNRPKMPPKRSGMERWFEYYYKCKNGGFKYTLEDLAEDSDYSYGYIRQQHQLYKIKHGLETPNKKT